MYGPYGGFEDVAREARGELMEEARRRHLARLARPKRGLRERLAPALGLVAGWFQTFRTGGEEAVGPDVGEVPDVVYLAVETSAGSEGGPGTVVEVYLGAGGCVVRRTDLRTGTSTDAFVADGPVRR